MLKRLKYGLTGLFLSLFSSLSFAENVNDLMMEMSDKVKQGNYELVFVHSDLFNNESMLYRHSISENNDQFAQLLYMDGPKREVLLQNDKIAYFQQGLQPFSIKGKKIVDAIPSLFYSNISEIKPYYQFVLKGRDRVSNRDCQVVELIDKDNARYRQFIWIDEATHFPLRVDLVDEQGVLLEQFRAISVKENNEGMRFVLDAIGQMQFPPLLDSSFVSKSDPTWKLNWLPDGFKEISRFTRKIDEDGHIVESALFSDDVFSFSLSVSPLNKATKSIKQYIKQGSRSIYIDNKNKKEVIIIGELPEKTAKKLVSSLVIK